VTGVELGSFTHTNPIGHTVTEGEPLSPKQPSQRLFDSSHEATLGKPVFLQQGQSYSFTFLVPGTYNYYCIPHPYMTGQVIVLSANSGDNSTNSYTNFTITLNGNEVLGIAAFGAVFLLAISLVLCRPGPNKPEERVPNAVNTEKHEH